MDILTKYRYMGRIIFALCYLTLVCLNQPAYAQSYGESKKSKNGKRKNKEKEERDSSKVLDYDYEFMTSVGVNFDTGSLNKTGEDAEKFNNQTVFVDLMTGVLFGDHFEPIFEASYTQTTNIIGDYKETKNNLNWGLGALFNIPTGGKPDKSGADANAPAFANSDWIPFGGFIFSGTSHDESGGNGTNTTIVESGLRTKLIFGSRYMLYPHIGLNFWIRMSYEQSASEVTEPDKTGGTVDKLSIQSNLLSFTMFF